MIKELEYSKCLYFGCVDEVGHYLFGIHGKSHGNAYSWISKRDGMLAPVFCREAGKALLHHYDGFTIIAFWDYSVDTRPGSNSMFIIPGTKDFYGALEIANRYFPQVFKRFSFEVEQLAGSF